MRWLGLKTRDICMKMNSRPIFFVLLSKRLDPVVKREIISLKLSNMALKLRVFRASSDH
jgi:hypothetical protein